MTFTTATACAASFPEAEPSISPPHLRTHRVAAAFRGLMEALELDLSDPDLAETPLRVARLYRELFAGMDLAASPCCGRFPIPTATRKRWR